MIVTGGQAPGQALLPLQRTPGYPACPATGTCLAHTPPSPRPLPRSPPAAPRRLSRTCSRLSGTAGPPRLVRLGYHVQEWRVLGRCLSRAETFSDAQYSRREAMRSPRNSRTAISFMRLRVPSARSSNSATHSQVTVSPSTYMLCSSALISACSRTTFVCIRVSGHDRIVDELKKVARKVGRGYDVPEDGGGAVGVSGGGTTVGECVGFSVGECVGVTTAVGVLVTTTVVALLELHPVIAAAVTTAPQPITKIIFALLMPSPPPRITHL
jgi:hypothetical protein